MTQPADPSSSELDRLLQRRHQLKQRPHFLRRPTDAQELRRLEVRITQMRESQRV